jgi:hypothetical protein
MAVFNGGIADENYVGTGDATRPTAMAATTF